MEAVKICRICLVMDADMQNLEEFPWDTYWDPVFDMNLLTAMGLPPYACYECATRLKNSYRFREKCLLGQSVLQSILQINGVITADLVRQVNRQELNLVSRLQPRLITEETIINISYLEPKVKDEPNDIEIDELMNGKLTEVGDLEPIEEKLELFKEEDGYDDFPLETLSTDDDEPLSLHKSKKEKKTKDKKKSKKTRKTVPKKELLIGIDFPNQVATDSSIENLLSEPQVKRKRGRPKKYNIVETEKARKSKKRRTNNTGGVSDDDMDLEEHVTVIKMTLEEQIEEINKRRFSSNYANAQFQCNLCFKGFIDTHAWRHHVGKHDPSAGDVECPVCKFRFKTKRILQKHANNHEKKYACKSCPYVSKTVTQAKQHQRWHKGVTYKCQYCNEISTKWTSYLSHVRMKHPSEFVCGACGYSFVSGLGLAMHRTMMHKDILENSETSQNQQDGPYCEECDVKFVSVEAYKRHKFTSVKHKENEHFKSGCRVCGDSFKTAEELRLHHRNKHARKRPKNYGKKSNTMTWPSQCEHCPEMIQSAREYWAHFRRAHPDRSYPIQKDHVCDICGKSFRGNAFLVYHKRTHSSERAYKCALCPKAFYNRTNLQMHEKTHSDRRPYPCDICFKAFKCKGALDRHYRSHTGVKPYECEVCGKAFGQSNSRKLHVRTVHLKQPAPYVSRARLERRRQPPEPYPHAYQ